MEQRDKELISRYSSSDPTLSDLYRQHIEFENELEKLENKSYLSVAEQMKVAEIKKKKLLGKDKIERLLAKYRRSS